MPYLSDLRYYMSGTEAPDVYLTWTGLSLLSAVMGRRFWTYHGRYKINPMLYVILVGEAGSGKSACRSEVKRIFVKTFPQLKHSSSIQSREDIADIMASPDCIQTWKDTTGEYGPKDKIYEYRPFYIISNEFASLLSVDKEKMVGFLVDIYDDDDFSTGFKGQRKSNPDQPQWFENQAVTMLACATPRWFMRNLHFDLFEGGLGRRLIIVNSEKTVLVAEPMLPLDAGTVMDTIILHVQRVHAAHGEIRKTPEAVEWWNDWYNNKTRFNQDDPILNQFHQTKHIQLLKVAMLLSMCDYPFLLEMDVHHLKGALMMLDSLEKDIGKLTRGVGRNVLAGIAAAMLDFVEKVGGKTSETHLKKFFWRELQTPECVQVLQHLMDTQQLRLYNAGGINFFFTPSGWAAYVQSHTLGAPLPSFDGSPHAPVDGVAQASGRGVSETALPEAVDSSLTPPPPSSPSPQAPQKDAVPPSSLELEPHEPSAQV